jgi:hypothetical protein
LDINNTLNVSRATLGTPFGSDLRKAGFRARRATETQQHAHSLYVPHRAPPSACIFVKLNSETRRVATTVKTCTDIAGFQVDAAKFQDDVVGLQVGVAKFHAKYVKFMY